MIAKKYNIKNLNKIKIIIELQLIKILNINNLKINQSIFICNLLEKKI